MSAKRRIYSCISNECNLHVQIKCILPVETHLDTLLHYCYNAFLQRGVSNCLTNTRVTGKQRNLFSFARGNSDWRKKTVPACCHPQQSQAHVPDTEAHFWEHFCAIVVMRSLNKVSPRVTFFVVLYFAHVSGSTACAIQSQPSHDWQQTESTFTTNCFMVRFWRDPNYRSSLGNKRWVQPKEENTHKFTAVVH